MRNEQNEIECSNVSLITAKIISNQVVPRSLFCPFCADEYLFEFSLKDHLRRKHLKDLEQGYSNESSETEGALKDCLCPYCKAVFYSKSIIPKHIFHHHGRNWLHNYQQNHGLNKLADKENEITITYTSCSPGLSDIFEKLMCQDLHSDNSFENVNFNSPGLKSILKKTPSKPYNPILGTPSSVSIRRYRSALVRQSLSVRRELRFDLPPLQKSPQQVIRKHKKFLDLFRLFKFRKSSNKIIKSSPIKKLKNKNDKYFKLNIAAGSMITSTPVSFLDEDTLDDFADVLDSREINENFNKVVNEKHKKFRRTNQPLIFLSERFACGCCDEKYISNTDLLVHSKEKHTAKCFLKKFFKCGECGKKFFKNRNLMRHTFTHIN